MRLRNPLLAGFLLLFAFALTPKANSQVFASAGATVNNMGQPIGAALMSICNADPGNNPAPCSNNLVQTYTDNTLTTPCTLVTSPEQFYQYGYLWGPGCTNPGRVSTRANYTIYAPPDILYYAQVYGYGFTTYTMPFATAGAGGSATLPCGVQYDVQINQPLNHFGCDTGVFTENNSTHTLIMGTTGTPGNVVTNEINLIAGAPPSFPGAGYAGLLAPAGANVQFQLPGAVGTDGQFLYQASHSGNTAVLSYAASAGICGVPGPWQASYFCGVPSSGGQYGSLQNAAFNDSTVTGTAPMTVTLPSVYRAGDALVFGGEVTGTILLSSTATDTCGNTWTKLSGVSVWYVTNAVACSTPDVITVTVASGAGSWIASAAEGWGSGAFDSYSSGNTGCSGSNPTINSLTPVTTTNADALFVMAYGVGGAGAGYVSFVPGTVNGTQPFTLSAPGQLSYFAGGVGLSYSAMMQWAPAVTVGSNTATYGWNPLPGGSFGCTSDVVTLAFKPSVTNPPLDPGPVLITQQNLIDGGTWTPLAVGNFPWWNGYRMQAGFVGSGLSFDQTTGILSATSGGGSVTSFSSGNLTPLFTTSVATPTTTPAQTFTLSNAGANTIFGNWSGSSGPPSYNTMLSGSSCGDSTHATGWTAGTGFFCQSLATGGDTITSPNSTLSVGGTTTNTTLDVIGATSGVASVPQQYTSTPSGVPGWTVAGTPPNAQTGTTYTFVATDRGKWVNFSNSGSIAVTLPQAGSTGFATNILLLAKNLGAGTVTITPTTSTIDGNATLTITQGQSCAIFSDNTNYFSQCGNGKITAGANITLTPNSAGVQIAASGGGGGTPGGTNGEIQYNNSGAFGGDTATTDGSGNLKATTLGLGGSPPTACGSITGCLAQSEGGSAGTPTSGQDYIYSNSTKHGMVASFNGDTENLIARFSGSFTNGHCAEVSVSGSIVLLTDAGGPCSGTNAYINLTGSVTVSGCTVSSGACVVSGSSTSTVTLSSIPGTYNQLRLIVVGRFDDTANAEAANLRFNSDSGNNYDCGRIYGGAVGPGNDATVNGSTSAGCAFFNAASMAAGYPGQAEYVIPLYAGTTFDKTYSILGGATNNSTAGPYNNAIVSADWRSTAAITSISLTDGGGGHWLAGSTFMLYGVQ